MVKDFMSLRRMQAVSWLYLLVLVIGSWLAFSWQMAWSVLAGGVIAIGSFLVSQREVSRFLGALTTAGEEGGGAAASFRKSGYLLKFWLRIALIGVVLLLLIKSGWVNIFGLILGLSTIVFAVTFTALDAVRRYYFSGRR